MFLQSLPTELDLRILQFLDTIDISRVTRVSKYYRKIAEPLLYESVTFWQIDGDRIRFLLDTILSSTELCPLIKRFSLSQDRPDLAHLPANKIFPPSNNNTNSVHERMWSQTIALHEAVEALASSSEWTTDIERTGSLRFLSPSLISMVLSQ